MNLRTRILLGYGYLVGLLILSAAGAALGFQQLGANIGQLLNENFESVRACMTMLEALERQDSAVLGTLLGKGESRDLLTNSEQSFLEGLKKARAHINLPGEDKVLAEIKERFKTYCEARDALLAGTHERPLLDYEEEASPRFEDVKKSVMALLDINHQAMVAADLKAQRTANLRAVLHGILVAIALLSLGFLSREMRRNIIDRLEELRAVADAIAQGDRSRRISVRRIDELGLVARQLNAILDREQDVEGEMNARLIEQRRWILGLLRRIGDATAVFSLSGDLVASTLLHTDQRIVQEAVGKALQERRNELPNSWEVITGGKRIQLDLMISENKQPVGWFVTVATEKDPRSPLLSNGQHPG